MKPVLSQTEPRALRASPLQPPPGPCPSPSAGHQPRSCGGSGLVPGCEWLGCGLQAFPGGLQASLGV
ncbi:hypothetical protein CapIbe_022268 [Capra ibex]